MNKCPCIATNHPLHVSGECDEPVNQSGYTVCATCRYATTPEEQGEKDED